MIMTENMRGAALMAGSMVAFTVNDAFMKALSDELPLFQAIFLRGLGTVVCLFVLAYALGQLRWDFGRKNWMLIGLRTFAEVTSTVFFLTALYNMPLANVSAILQALPLTVSLAAAIFLGEALGWRRMFAICVGFVGVMMIVRPGAEGFTIYSISALIAVVFVTLRDLAVRRMTADVPSVFESLVAAVSVTTFAGLMTAPTQWVPVSPTVWLQLGGAMLALVFGYVFSVTAMRHGEIGFVASFRYASLIAALILGYLVFDDWPAPIVLMGAFVVVATGLFTLYRERRAASKA